MSVKIGSVVKILSHKYTEMEYGISNYVPAIGETSLIDSISLDRRRIVGNSRRPGESRSRFFLDSRDVEVIFELSE